MALPFELAVGLRYTKAGRRGRRKDGFMSFISGISVASIALGVMALIIVLSVMNGFQKEVRDRMLSVLSHAEVYNLAGSVGNWQDTLGTLKAAESRIVAGAPFVSGQALLSAGAGVQGAMVRGIDPAAEPSVSDIPSAVRMGSVDNLKAGSFGIILGRDLARQLRVGPGDKVTLIVSKGNVTPAGFVPRMKQMTVMGLVDSGHYEFDSTLCVMNVTDAATLFRTGGATGIRLKLSDMNEAPAVVRSIRQHLPSGWYATDWTMQNRTWFAAVGGKDHDVDHSLFDRAGGRFRTGIDAGDDSDGKAVRHCHFAHTRSKSRLNHAHFHDSGQHRGLYGCCRRRQSGALDRLQSGRHRAIYRRHPRRRIPAQGNLLHQFHAI